ncbi:MAG TPA: FAD-binding oxidoreductase [Caulobacteraceae bacterium]|nr:FAD-binding oxidoreductase [Caulobacteraceae bacterium]
MSANAYDIVVIGAGMAGASAAAHLALNRRVLVLEREGQPGYHSTGRSAALFSAIYGSEPVRALSRASHDFFYAPPPAFAPAPLVRPRAAMHIATAEQAERLAAFGALPDVAPVSRIITRDEALKLCPILRPEQLHSAVVELEAADVDVHGLHQGYLRQLREREGVLLTDRTVEGLGHEGGRWRITSNGEEFFAPVVVNAAGAWADVIAGLAGVAPIGLQPMRRTAILVEPPAGAEIDDWPMVIDADEQFYFKPDAGLLLLSPADETPMAPCDVQPDEWDVAVAVDRVETATTLKITRVKHRWAGLRSFVADRTPVAGYDPDAPGFFWLAGQGGYGIQTAPALSRAAAALVLDQTIPATIAAHGVNAADLSPARLRQTAQTPREAIG